MNRSRASLSAYLWVAVIVGILTSISLYTYVQATDQYISRLQTQSESRVAGARLNPDQAAVVLQTGTQKTRYALTLPTDSQRSALDALRQAAASKNWTVRTSTGQYGTLVEEINGLTNGADGKYWIYYVNGEMAAVGADQYTVKAGDTIEYRFEASQF